MNSKGKNDTFCFFLFTLNFYPAVITNNMTFVIKEKLMEETGKIGKYFNSLHCEG